MTNKTHNWSIRKCIELFCIGLLVVLVISQRQTLFDSLELLIDADLPYVVLALASIWVALPFAASIYQLLSPRHLPFGDLLLVHMAGSGPGKLVPGGLGLIGIGSLYFRKKSVSLKTAATIPILTNVIGAGAHGILLLLALSLNPSMEMLVNKSLIRVFIVLLLAAILLFFVVLYSKRSIQKTFKKYPPKKLFGALLLSSSIPIIHALCLVFSAFAIGETLSPAQAFVALSVGVGLGSIIPTPGGLGGVEVGVTTALVSFGYSVEIATATAILYRLATYWQPMAPGIVAYYFLKNKKLI